VNGIPGSLRIAQGTRTRPAPEWRSLWPGSTKNMKVHYLLMTSGLLGLVALCVASAQADVTVEQQTSIDLSFIKAHGKSTELTTTDKRRHDDDLHCEGFMSMVCGNAEHATIIRLDRGVEWTLEPKKKEYRESAFPTAAERAAAQQQAQAMMEKIKQCPAMQHGASTPSAPDTATCQLSEPKIDVKQTGSHASFAGHDAQLTQIALTQSCTDKTSGDVCDFVFTMDSWLTQDAIAGLDERQAFQAAYREKLGIDERGTAQMRTQLSQFLAPYAGTLKQLSAKADQLKGHPLKTAVRIAFGGEHCAAAKGQPSSSAGGSGNVVGDAGQAAADAASSSASSAAGAAAGSAAANAVGNSAGSSVASSAASAFGSKLMSGLFQKKTSPPATAAAPAAATSAPPPNMVQAAEVTVETTAITVGTVQPAQFEIPAGWKLVPPQPKSSSEFTCPSAGG